MENALLSDLESQLDYLAASPSDAGTLDLIVSRPAQGERIVHDEATLDVADGLLGDNWFSRATSRAVAEGRHLDAMLNVMNARMVSLLAPDAAGQALAGDQLYVDFDISHTNLPTGARLAIGETVIEVTAKPHNGCLKFEKRFGPEAVAFVNSDRGKRMRLRGLNARVIEGGTIRPGDVVRKV